MAEQATTDYDWGIATACDVNLAHELQQSYPGCFIDIDASSIEYTLHALNPEASGRLYFEVVDDNNPSLPVGCVALAHRKNKIGADPDAEVRIGMPGNNTPQKTSVHELQHVIDYGDETLMRQKQRRLWIGAPIVAASFLLTEAAATGISYEILSLTTSSEPMSALGSLAILALITKRLYGTLITSGRYRINKVTEKRAEETERWAASFSPIITIKPIL